MNSVPLVKKVNRHDDNSGQQANYPIQNIMLIGDNRIGLLCSAAFLLTKSYRLIWCLIKSQAERVLPFFSTFTIMLVKIIIPNQATITLIESTCHVCLVASFVLCKSSVWLTAYSISLFLCCLLCRSDDH